MLTIICGEDNISSRNYFIEIQSSFRSKGYDIQSIGTDQILEIPRWLGESQTLFNKKMAYFTENISKKITRKGSGPFAKTIEQIIEMKDVELISWENALSLRELKIPKQAIIKEFKADTTIFKFLDSCFPGNGKQFVTLLHSLPEKIEVSFIFIMLVRHIRNLLLIQQNTPPKTIQQWQVWKLKSQLKYWKNEALLNFYDALLKIEISSKTGNNPYTIKKSLDLLACYFL
jgi:hypothetical protein